MGNLLELKNVELIYHSPQSETHALEKLSFEVENGEFVSIVGPSGCGKTTLLSLIAGILKPTGGQIVFSGQHDTTTSQTGYMFQRDNLFEWLSIWKNVTLGLGFKNRNTKENKDYSIALLDKYGLGNFKNHYPSQLSGGMRQRVALIRTLAVRPKLLLLDEPFSALDYQTRLAVQDDVHSIIKNEKKTAILVTHDIGEAIALSSKIIVLTSRPGSVKKIINIDFDPYLTPFERRKDIKFNQYFNQIWGELDQ